jgi:iron complex transport system substrate-binding protein
VSRFYGQVQLPEFRSQSSFPGKILAELGTYMPVNQMNLVKFLDDYLIILSFERIYLLDAHVLFVPVDMGAKELFRKY